MKKVNWSIACSSDMDGEYYSHPGHYSASIKTEHTYYCTLDRSCGKWFLRLYWNFHCYNARDVKIYDGKFKTMKEATAFLMQFIPEYESGPKSEFDIWANEVRRPVYKVLKRYNRNTWTSSNVGVEFAGWAYLSLGSHDSYDFTRYRNDSIPMNYGDRSTFISPGKNYIDYIEFNGCGYGTGGMSVGGDKFDRLCGPGLLDEMKAMHPEFWVGF